jgi:peptidoglycan-N-acetylglucosamine deacetylase
MLLQPLRCGEMCSEPVLTPLIVTTSWDDGHPSDLRLAELLDKHGLRGTFYIPCRGPDGQPVLHAADIVQLAQRFEIGAHTRDHIDLTEIARYRAAQQIVANKSRLEDLLGREVSGFAYVRGRYNRSVRDLVADAGFKYARTVKNLMTTPPFDPFQCGTTAQFFPHSQTTLISNFMSHGPNRQRFSVLRMLLGDGKLSARLLRAAQACARSGGHFHLWGHSWELDAHDLWQDLDCFLRELQHLNVRFVTNSAFYTYSEAKTAIATDGAEECPGIRTSQPTA